MRKSPKVTEVLPILYLRGLSTGDFAPALAEFFGSSAGLSASTVNRLTEAWQAEHEDWSARDLSGVDYVYLWADGVVRHEAPFDRVGGKDPPVACRSEILAMNLRHRFGAAWSGRCRGAQATAGGFGSRRRPRAWIAWRPRTATGGTGARGAPGAPSPGCGLDVGTDRNRVGGQPSGCAPTPRRQARGLSTLGELSRPVPTDPALEDTSWSRYWDGLGRRRGTATAWRAVAPGWRVWRGEGPPPLMSGAASGL